MNLVRWMVVAGSLTLCMEVQAKELAVIANKAYPADGISLSVLKEIYLGDKMVEQSVRILPVDQEDPTIKRKFVEEILGSTVQRYDAYWFLKKFKDGVVPPIVRESSPDVILFLEREVGGVGYVWGTEVQGKSRIKVLRVIEVGE